MDIELINIPDKEFNNLVYYNKLNSLAVYFQNTKSFTISAIAQDNRFLPFYKEIDLLHDDSISINRVSKIEYIN